MSIVRSRMHCVYGYVTHLVERPDGAVVGAGRVERDYGAFGAVRANAVQDARAAGVAEIHRQVKLLAGLRVRLIMLFGKDCAGEVQLSANYGKTGGAYVGVAMPRRWTLYTVHQL